jgi:hypothetical protein
MNPIREYDYFGDRISWLDRLRMQSSLKVRRQMYNWMSDRIGGVAGKTFLDHGSTPDTKHIDSNCLIRWLLEDGAIVYATSPENIKALEQVFPGLTVVNYPPHQSQIPPIDYIISSAVIEHVGSHTHQIAYLSTLLDLANGVILTTPNRGHWLDFHTKLPLLHWLPRTQHRFCLDRLGMKFWAKEENLRLLSQSDLTDIIQQATPKQHSTIRVEWYQPKFLGMVSNLVVSIAK